MASKLYGVNSIIIIFVFVLYCIQTLVLLFVKCFFCIIFSCILSYRIGLFYILLYLYLFLLFKKIFFSILLSYCCLLYFIGFNCVLLLSYYLEIIFILHW